MDNLQTVIKNLVAGNRILANEGIVDAMGHISARHPDNPKRYLLSCAQLALGIVKREALNFGGLMFL